MQEIPDNFPVLGNPVPVAYGCPGRLSRRTDGAMLLDLILASDWGWTTLLEGPYTGTILRLG
jgi:hypothetical protein